MKKGAEDSLKTAPKNRSEDLEARKKRTAEYALGDQVAQAVHCLNETPPIISAHSSPLNTIMERFGNLEKTLGHMIAANEAEIYSFMAQGSDTPMSKLLGKNYFRKALIRLKIAINFIHFRRGDPSSNSG